jgi:toxin-antitoxin system PIN domain toxin
MGSRRYRVAGRGDYGSAQPGDDRSETALVTTVTMFAGNRSRGWATCPITESGFVRVSSNPKVLPSPIAVGAARGVLTALRAVEGHRFLTDDVSISDPDVPEIFGHRQVTDAHLLALARRHGVPLLTFDAAIATLAGGRDVELLMAL